MISKELFGKIKKALDYRFQNVWLSNETILSILAKGQLSYQDGIGLREILVRELQCLNRERWVLQNCKRIVDQTLGIKETVH